MNVNNVNEISYSLNLSSNNGARDIFLRLLITQIKSQNPLEPMKTQEFTSQITQLTSLEYLFSIENLLKTQIVYSQLESATSFIDKTVSGFNTDGSKISGTVQQVFFTNGKIYLLLNNGYTIPFENLIEIK